MIHIKIIAFVWIYRFINIKKPVSFITHARYFRVLSKFETAYLNRSWQRCNDSFSSLFSRWLAAKNSMNWNWEKYGIYEYNISIRNIFISIKRSKNDVENPVQRGIGLCEKGNPEQTWNCPKAIEEKFHAWQYSKRCLLKK